MTLGLHAWTVHPFTACSLPSSDRGRGARSSSELIFVIRPRGGFTARLAHLVESLPNTKVRVLLDGPYGGVDVKALQNSKRTLVIAGGSGAGWTLPFINSFLRHTAKDLSSTADARPSQSMKVILATRDMLTTKWFEEEVQRLLDSIPTTEPKPTLDIEIYYTGSKADMAEPRGTEQLLKVLNESPKSAPKLEPDQITSYVSKSDESDQNLVQRVQHIQHVDSRPDLVSIIQEEVGSISQSQPLGVFVCGPLSMQSDVANTVAFEQLHIAKKGTGDVVLHIEHFS